MARVPRACGDDFWAGVGRIAGIKSARTAQQRMLPWFARQKFCVAARISAVGVKVASRTPWPVGQTGLIPVPEIKLARQRAEDGTDSMARRANTARLFAGIGIFVHDKKAAKRDDYWVCGQPPSGINTGFVFPPSGLRPPSRVPMKKMRAFFSWEPRPPQAGEGIRSV